ncbi:hypothetical protein LTR91_014596 [Friedmanniomyces endolithicus]|uniref:RRM domain-containing protein n=1 Tax=Friedmanniomyces endolithicus TaxID=329885 RepID=A0AAN6QN67_9PEZI|nr:hypothetical protein LTR82_016125 [Friedmanniomyces endolithicus]KAK0311937.1 hypothetical protein LTR01_002851 [Friedmanniomyces endolithicus]KAK0832170.1 hypothetical protein LTR73_002457 [Friedmanniomyces endolithicus]KAK0904746.1 hypothetical protein LTR57_018587 [Friedmanniomyces endolithicus]KAK0969770.1 hypothetical protein LTS01_016088 [Friedmanniomyces endolithicus]
MVPMPPSHPPIPQTINDFTILPLHIPPLPSFPRETTHYLYLRPNAPKLPTETTPRELFLVNVPVDATETHLRALFAEQLGGARVESVGFEGAQRTRGRGITGPVAVGTASGRGKKRKRGEMGEGEVGAEGREVGGLPEVYEREVRASGGTAVVAFVDRASAEMAVREVRRAVRSGRRVVWDAGVEGKVPALGLAGSRAEHALRYPDPAVLQQSVDDFMAAFSAQEAVRAKELARVRSVPDADGFVTVTRGARMVPAAREEDVEKVEESARKREKKKVGEDFYRFQVREKRKEEQLGLVRGFEEDQRRVEEMRRRRGKVRPE